MQRSGLFLYRALGGTLDSISAKPQIRAFRQCQTKTIVYHVHLLNENLGMAWRDGMWKMCGKDVDKDAGSFVEYLFPVRVRLA